MDTDADLQSKLMEDNVLAVFDEVGYRGIPSRETLESKDKIVRYYYIYTYNFQYTVHKYSLLKKYSFFWQVYNNQVTNRTKVGHDKAVRRGPFCLFVQDQPCLDLCLCLVAYLIRMQMSSWMVKGYL